MSSDDRPDGVTLLDGAVLLAELVLLAVLAVAGARLGGSTGAKVALAVGLPLAAAVVWGACSRRERRGGCATRSGRSPRSTCSPPPRYSSR